jgi:large subunit ribosomal protein L13
MKTPMQTKESVIRVWHLIDLNQQTLGRTATKIAKLLMGKDKPTFTPHIDGGDYVVALNAAKVKVTGNKTTGKIYRHHTGYPGGFREFRYEEVMAKDPRKIILEAVKGMLPKNKLRDIRMKRLKVFVDDQHPYAAHMKQPANAGE